MCKLTRCLTHSVKKKKKKKSTVDGPMWMNVTLKRNICNNLWKWIELILEYAKKSPLIVVFMFPWSFEYRNVLLLIAFLVQFYFSSPPTGPQLNPPRSYYVVDAQSLNLCPCILQHLTAGQHSSWDDNMLVSKLKAKLLKFHSQCSPQWLGELCAVLSSRHWQ